MKKSIFKYYKLKGKVKFSNSPAKEFALRISKAMDEIGSSHVYFIMQQAYGDIDYSTCQEIWKEVQSELKQKN